MIAVMGLGVACRTAVRSVGAVCVGDVSLMSGAVCAGPLTW